MSFIVGEPQRDGEGRRNQSPFTTSPQRIEKCWSERQISSPSLARNMSLKKEVVIFRDPFTFTFKCPLSERVTHNHRSRLPWRRTGGRFAQTLSFRLAFVVLYCYGIQKTFRFTVRPYTPRAKAKPKARLTSLKHTAQFHRERTCKDRHHQPEAHDTTRSIRVEPHLLSRESVAAA